MLEGDVNFSVTARSGEVYPVTARHSLRAKRVSLKIDTQHCVAVLVLPQKVSLKRGKIFAQKNADWIATHLKHLPAKTYFEIGSQIPFKGQNFTLRHAPDQRDVTIQIGAESHLDIGGPILGFAQRVERYLRTQARETLTLSTQKNAKNMQVSPKTIRIKDTKTRWGSCSSAGTLNYSWRLILTPPEILNYVVVHECAHLREMNHSPAFWAIVAEYDPNWKQHRAWLRQNGHGLHGIG